jgi:hypothetical protein
MRKPTQRYRNPIEAIERRLLLSTTIYVDANASSPTHDGASWPTAFIDLQQALAIATAGDEIHVADGVYKPTSGTDRTAYFRLNNQVRLLGGYAGDGAEEPDARDPALHLTILSGDIGVVGKSTDNSNRILSCSGGDASTVLDGFTVTEVSSATSTSAALGIFNGSPSISTCIFLANHGAGISNSSSSPTIVDCDFIGNLIGSPNNGAMLNNKSSPYIRNCRFTQNTGRAMYNSASSPTLTDCVFEKNLLGMSNTGSSPVLSGCDFIGNSTGGMANYAGSSPVITGSSFIENHATQYGGAIYNNASSASISGCTFTRNVAGDLSAGYPGEGGAVYAWGTLQTDVVNCRFNGNQAARQGGAALGNLMMINCSFSGNSAPVGAAVTYAVGVINCSFSANTSMELGGVVAYANQIVNCVVWGNSSLYAPVSGSFSAPSYSDIEGGAEGTGNIASDPAFYRNPAPGPDGKWGTADDDYGDLRVRAKATVDAGDNSAVPADVVQDLAGNNRFQDLQSIPDTGSGPAPVVDMGAYEAGPQVVADAGGPYFVAEGYAITLHGVGRSGVPGSLTFEWEWSGNGRFDDGVGAQPVFSTNGLGSGSVIPVYVRVTDSTGNLQVAMTSITVVPTTVYVDSSATGRNDGTDWADGFTSLATALNRSCEGQTIRVASGRYLPSSAQDRFASFRLRSGVTVLGGYAGRAAANPNARDIALYPTILSGDLGRPSDNTDNSFQLWWPAAPTPPRQSMVSPLPAAMRREAPGQKALECTHSLAARRSATASSSKTVLTIAVVARISTIGQIPHSKTVSSSVTPQTAIMVPGCVLCTTAMRASLAANFWVIRFPIRAGHCGFTTQHRRSSIAPL